jgi:hypothetical protein
MYGKEARRPLRTGALRWFQRGACVPLWSRASSGAELSPPGCSRGPSGERNYEKAQRVMKAMMGMIKLDIQGLEDAAAAG